MSQIQIKALVEALQSQRNAALNAQAQAESLLALANAQINQLKQDLQNKEATVVEAVPAEGKS